MQDFLNILSLFVWLYIENIHSPICPFIHQAYVEHCSLLDTAVV